MSIPHLRRQPLVFAMPPDPPPGGGSSQDTKPLDSRDVPDEREPEPDR